MKFFPLIFLIPFIFYLWSSKKGKMDFKYQKERSNDEIFKSKIIIILKGDLDPNSSTINVQDYIENGKSFIPIFSSVDNFNESTKGMIKNKKIYIDGMFFLSVLHGNETLRLDPTLKGETYFQASVLLKKYAANIEEVKKRLFEEANKRLKK